MTQRKRNRSGSNSPAVRDEAADRQPQRQTTSQIQAQFRSGPLPDPDALERYEYILPGMAERIMVMAEQQAAHRRNLERTVINGDVMHARWGLICGTLVSLAFLGVAGVMAWQGNVIVAGIFGTINIVGLVGVFIYGTASRRNEREQNRQN